MFLWLTKMASACVLDGCKGGLVEEVLRIDDVVVPLAKAKNRGSFAWLAKRHTCPMVKSIPFKNRGEKSQANGSFGLAQGTTEAQAW